MKLRIVDSYWRCASARIVAALCLASGLLASARHGTASDDREAPEPQFTRKTKFSIPFSVDGEEGEQVRPLEVQLHVSENHGVTWKRYARAKANEHAFRFEARHDGEYWFMVQTLDQNRQVVAEGTAEPEMIVVVDTAPPDLIVYAARGEANEVHVHWRLSDPHLDERSLQVEYELADAPGSWQKIAVDNRSGEARFVPDGEGSITIRARAADLAGNRAVSDPVRVEATSEVSRDKVAEAREAEDGTSDERSSRGVDPSHVPGEAATEPDESNESEAWPPEMSEEFPGDQRGEVADARRDRQAAHSPSRDRLTEQARPKVGAQYVYPTRDEGQANPEGGASRDAQVAAMAGSQTRMVNSRKFELEYDVDLAGAARIEKVELWGTRDGGVKWSSFGIDADNASPMLVTVDDDGIYGFLLVVDCGDGRDASPPRSGDLPEVWVGVDTAKPEARLTTAELVSDEHANKLVIRWEAADEKLSDRPITLWFKESADAEWATLRAGLENTGSFTWELEKRSPKSVYLRLEVRDAAGNTQLVDSAQPVALRQGTGHGRIRNVRPVSESARQPKRIQNLQ